MSSKLSTRTPTTRSSSSSQTSSSSNANDTTYWTVSHGIANRIFTCRECKKSIMKGEPISVRDARKIRLIYHAKCFSGSADPRTQENSSFQAGKEDIRRVISEKAPRVKGHGKWSTSNVGFIGTSVSGLPTKRPSGKSSSRSSLGSPKQ